MKAVLIACTMLVSATAPAFAGDAPRAAAPQPMAPRGQVMVTVCERDALTQAAFRRQHGATPGYVTADQVMSARAAGERWEASRCMTDRQHRELVQRLSPRSPR